MAKKKAAQNYRETTLDDLVGEGMRFRRPEPLPEVADQQQGRTLGNLAGDIGISLLKGAVAVPEAAVGLADIPTGGRVGQALESVGFRPGDAKAFLDENLSDAQKRANLAVQEADGFTGKLGAALQNPSVIGHTVLESLPAMGAGGVVGRGVAALAPRLGAVGGAAIGEGVVAGGGAAEQIRQETPDGLLTPAQAALAGATGVGTGVLGALGGRVAQAMGLNDIDTLIVQGARSAGARKGIVRRVLEGAVAEGVLEELPQSIQEQVLQNAALGKDLTENVDLAAVLGMLSGAAMGGGANVMGPGRQQAANDPAPSPVLALPVPDSVVRVDGAGNAEMGLDDPQPRWQAREAEAAARAARGGVIEKGPLSRAANVAAGEVIDVEPRPVGTLARAASEAQPVQGATNESANDSTAADAPAGQLPGEGGAQLPATGVAPFATYEEADAYRREQTKRGATVAALPVPGPEGGFALAMKGTAEYLAGERLRDERRAAKERADAGILDGDVLNAKGKPFTIRLPALNAAKKAGEGWEVAEVKGGFVARRAPTTPAAEAVKGEPIEGEWSAFAPESGTLAIPRADMPQIAAEHRGAMVNFLGARGITADEATEIPADQLKPTQAEFSRDKVKKAREFTGGDRSILVSADGHVLDGHHQWVAKLEAGEPVKAIRLNAPIAQLLEQVRQMPSATTDEGAPATAPPGSSVVADEGPEWDAMLKSAEGIVRASGKGSIAEVQRHLRIGYNRAARLLEALEKSGVVGPMGPNGRRAVTSAPAADSLEPVNSPAGKSAVSSESDETATSPASAPAPADAAVAPARKKALDRIEKGTAYFFDRAKAQAFIDNAGLADSHELVPGEKGRIDVRAKAAQPAPAASTRRLVDEAPNGIKAGDRVIVTSPERTDTQGNTIAPAPYEGQVVAIEKNDASAYGGWAFKVARDDSTEDGRGVGWVGVDRVSLAPAPTPAPAPAPKGAPAAKANIIFTEDAAAAARARMKKKLGQLNSGIDPELLQDGIVLAGYHIERGARTFSAYAQAMLGDMGEAIRPYLKQLYMALKFDPRASALDGLDSAAAVESADLDSIAPAAAPADTGGTESGQDAARELDSASPGALAGAPAEDVRAPVEGRDAGEGAGGRGRRDGGRDPGADGDRGDVAGSVGAGEGAVPVPARGARAAAPDAEKRRVPRARWADAGPEQLRPQQQGLSLEDPNPAPNAPVIAAPQVTAEDFTIGEDLALGEGGQKTKFRNNVAAIRLVKEFIADPSRRATPEEQQVLAKYVGWGGLPQAFDPANADWAKEHAELSAVLTPEEFADARRSTRYAHYTSREIVVDGIYAALRRFGFTGGKTLEAGAGVGNFLGLMPADMRSAGRFTAIEREPISSAIARQLYPQQIVQQADFTEFKGNDGYFDAAVGNPPFASDAQTDASGRKHLSGLSLHNYFFAKAVDMLREGGVLAQVVTNAFLDAQTDAARRYIADRTVFLGAIRLPNNAFSKNAGTEVTTDIVFLQKRPDGEIGGRAAKVDARRWLGVGTHTDARGKQVALNQYFLDNPDMMLGDFGAHGTMYGPDHPALVAREGQDTLALLRAAVGRLPAGVYTSIAEGGAAGQTAAAVRALKNPTVQEGGFFVEGGKLLQRLPDLGGEARATEITPGTQWTEKTTLGDGGFQRIKALAELRGTVRGLIAAEMADDDKGMGQLRTQLNKQYDAYRADHGLINDPSTLRVFDDDPDFPLLASLEHDYKPGVGPAAAKRLGIKPTRSTAKKGPIFDRRVVAARPAVRKVETPADALAVSMAERGKLDAAYIGQLLGRDADEVLRDLSSGDSPLLFRDPATDEYVLRDAYLSGNVRAKLAQARAAGMSANARALEEVQPADVGAHEISARVGSPWVPESVYEDFASALFGEGTEASVRYLKLNSSYSVSIRPGNEVAWNNTWGTPRMNGGDLLTAMLNNRAPKVTYRDSEGKTHTDQDATEAANNKAAELREKFNDWLFGDAERSEVLVRAYNNTNNNYVTRVYDGSHMAFPGKVPDEIIKFRRHQRNAIARIAQDRTALLDHVVGAGKTFTVVAGAMELKRTGLARKPMVAVPNHLVKQWAADFYRLYPGANILTATKKDFERANRRKFLAKVATGDWDAVVIAHSSFGFIKPAPEFEAAFNRKQVAAIMKTIESVQSEAGDKAQKKRTIKQLEGMKERLENRVKALRDKPMDDLLDFDQLGVDQLFVDEAHMFKNLMFSTKMQNVQGLGDSAGSQRAYDMLVKVSQIFAKNGRDQGVVFATGTPVSNSLAEMYHMMRYLMPTAMTDLGFDSFDAWANTFASVEQVWMQRPSGDGYKASNRMSNFVNTPELLKMFDQVSDTVTMDDIKTAYREENDGAEFPLPKLKGDRRTPVSLDKTPAQEDYMRELAKRAKVLEERKGPPQKGEDNVLVIMGDGRKAAMDIRLVDHTITEREPGGRIDVASGHIMDRYRRYAGVKGTQLVFSDLGTPIKHAKAELKEYEALQERIALANDDVQASATLGNEAAQAIVDDAEAAQAEIEAKGEDWLGAVQAALRGFSVYDDLKAALMEKGIPEAEIAFIHDFNTDEQKAGLFRKVNAGDIRVLLGSTAKMGAGTNVQERVVAEHHLDVPWRPSDVEQREGRIIRQGNVLMHQLPDFEVEILAYVTKDTLDMRMWQVQETKLKMINQLRTRKVGREIDNAFEDLELSAGEMQAAATGNIDLLHEIQLRADVKKLEQRKRSFDAQRNELTSRRKRNADNLRRLPGEIEAGEANANAVIAYRREAAAGAENFSATIDGREFTDWREAQDVLRGLTDARIYTRTVEKDGKKERQELTAAEFEALDDPKKQDQWDGRAAPLDVEMNGQRYTARAALAEAFSDLRGDMDPFAWTVGGQTYNRRTRAATAVRQAVVDAIADQTEKSLGAMGEFTVAVEGGQDRAGDNMLDLTISRDGKVVASRDMLVAGNATAHVHEQVIQAADRLLESIRSEHDWNKTLLRRAEKEKADLDATDDRGEWPEQARLEELRGKHKAVLKRLSAKPGEAVAPDAGEAPAFSRGASSDGMSVRDAQSAVDDLLAGWTNAPRVEVVASIDDPKVPERVRAASGDGPWTTKGFYVGGVAYVVADQVASPVEMSQVVFHEVLGHHGLRGAFGDALDGILRQIATVRRGEVAQKAKAYALDLKDEKQRLMAAEEVLAEMAQDQPQLGFVRKAIAAIRSWLRANVAAFRNLQMSDSEIIRNFILPAREWVTRGRGEATTWADSQSLAPAFSGGTAAMTEEQALDALSKADGIFAQPKPSATAKTVADIVAAINPDIKVRETKLPGLETLYSFTLPNGEIARMTVRRSNPYGEPSVYGAEIDDDNSYTWLTGRPGENPEDVDPDTMDVWIDVSELKRGARFGEQIYAVGAAYAHNNGAIFIGDPAGLSDAALRRRTEHMLASALKYGTTAHLAPHPRQVDGSPALGVPPLRWVYGDHLGNIQRMIDANLAALDNAFPNSKQIAFDPANGHFVNVTSGRRIREDAVREFIARGRGLEGAVRGGSEAGGRTVLRAAVLRALRSGGEGTAGPGRKDGLLASLLQAVPRVSDPRERIFYSRAASGSSGAGERLNDPRDFRAKATQAVSDLFSAPGAVGWWHKTIGTMHNLAQRAPKFRRVFDAVQTFLGDVSFYATEAADLAPRILPKLETWKDMLKSPLSAEDTKALSRPVFEGTLMWARDENGELVKIADLEKKYAGLSITDKAQMLLRRRRITPEQLQRWQASKLPVFEGAVVRRFEDEFLQAGVVFTDAELRSEFNATPRQIELYREFRAATDKSLNTLTISELLRFGGKDVADLRDMVLDAASASDAAILLRDHLLALADEQPARREVLIDTANKMVEKGDKAAGLIDRGYAPLSRFGHHTLDVLDENGERVYFGMFESRAEAAKMARQMRENFPQGTISRGTVSEQSYKMFAGITPETLEIFGEMIGLESDADDEGSQMFQQYLKLAKANRSAMKRLIHRKGIGGFSEDAGRVLAGFIYSNARQTSSNLHMGEIMQATADVPKSDGELKDMAVKLADYVRNPQEEAQAVRGMLFAQYLGGSLASAMVNMTQPFAVTTPYLSQWGGPIKAAGRMKSALADVMKKSTGDAKLDAALKQAEAEGIVAPQEVHQLMAQARGRAALQSGDGTMAGDLRAKAGNALSKVGLLWGKPFALAEQFNRRVTFIAAYRTAVEQGLPDPAGFAERAIAETQFIYNKGNKPQWARGAIGGTLFTFKQYSISYVELLHRMATEGGPEGRRAALFALAMLFLMGGAGGLPFVEDAEDVADGVMQRLGYNWSTKQARKQFLIGVVGKGAAEFIDSGVSGLPGMPLDVSGRLGMGNLLPGTGLLTKKADYGRDVAELLGPAGDLVQRVYGGAGKVLEGKPVEGAMMAAPKAAENLRKGIEMMTTGIYKDTKGRKVIDVDAVDALVKMVGFQPTDVAQVQEATFTQQKLIAQNRLFKAELADKMAVAVYEKDLDAQREVRQRMLDWNRKNPTSPVTIDMTGVRRRVIAMRQDKATRLANAAPKAIRAEVRKQLAEGSV